LKKNKTSKNWIKKQHRDQFFRESKSKGYRSRSFSKLVEMNNKFKILKKDTNLLDLGSSPGSWSQVAAKIITSGKILSIDIKPMEKIDNVSFLKANLLDSQINEKIEFFFKKKIDAVISDMAANTTGNKNLDSNMTGELCYTAMSLAEQILHQDGVFLSKVFMGSIFKEVIEKAEKTFKKVIKYKPLSSRKESKELYIYCNGLV